MLAAAQNDRLPIGCQYVRPHVMPTGFRLDYNLQRVTKLAMTTSTSGRGKRFTPEYAEGPIELIRCRAIIGSVAGFNLHDRFGGTQYNAASARTSRTESKYLAANKHCSLLVADNCGLHWDQPEWKVHQQLVRFSRCHWSSVCSIIRQKNFTPAAASHIPNTTRKLVIRMPESLACASC